MINNVNNFKEIVTTSKIMFEQGKKILPYNVYLLKLQYAIMLLTSVIT